jgi:hypothetical protein
MHEYGACNSILKLVASQPLKNLLGNSPQIMLCSSVYKGTHDLSEFIFTGENQ